MKYVDVRFTDVRGKMQHVTFDIDLVDDDFLNDAARCSTARRSLAGRPSTSRT